MFTLLLAVSIVLCAASAAMWARSIWARDWIAMTAAERWEIASDSGAIDFTHTTRNQIIFISQFAVGPGALVPIRAQRAVTWGSGACSSEIPGRWLQVTNRVEPVPTVGGTLTNSASFALPYWLVVLATAVAPVWSYILARRAEQRRAELSKAEELTNH